MVNYYYIGPRNDLVISNQRKCGISDCDIYATVDPGGGESARADHTAINVTAYNRHNGWAFVLEALSGNWHPDIAIEKIFEVVDKWAPFGLKKVGIEEVALQSYLRRFLQQEMRRRNRHFTVESLKVKGRSQRMFDKHTRILKQLQPYVANEQVFFLKHQKKLIRQMLGLRVIDGKIVGKSPNDLDALAWQCHWWTGATSKGNEEDDEETIPHVTKVKAPYGLRLS
jgi:hypothetical protein